MVYRARESSYSQAHRRQIRVGVHCVYEKKRVLVTAGHGAEAVCR